MLAYLKRKSNYRAESKKSNLLNITETKNNIIDIKLNKIDDSVAHLLDRIAQLETSLSVLKETLQEKQIASPEMKNEVESQQNSIFEHVHKKPSHKKQRRHIHENHRGHHHAQLNRGNRENSRRSYYRRRQSDTLPLFDLNKDIIEMQNYKKADAEHAGDYIIKFSVETANKPENLHDEANPAENPVFKPIFPDFTKKEELADANHEEKYEKKFRSIFHDFSEKDAMKETTHEEKAKEFLKEAMNEMHEKFPSKDMAQEPTAIMTFKISIPKEASNENSNSILKEASNEAHEEHDMAKVKNAASEVSENPTPNIIVPQDNEKPSIKNLSSEVNEKPSFKIIVPQDNEKANQKESFPKSNENLNFKDIFPDVTVEDPIIEVKRFDDITDFNKYKDSILNHKKPESDNAAETSYYRMSDVLGHPNHPTELSKKEVLTTLEQKNDKPVGYEHPITNKESEERDIQSTMNIIKGKSEEEIPLKDTIVSNSREKEKEFKFCESFLDPKAAYNAGRCIFKDANLSAKISMFNLSPAEHKMLMNPTDLLNKVHDKIKHVERKIKETKEEDEKTLKASNSESKKNEDSGLNKVEVESQYISMPKEVETLQAHSKSNENHISMESKGKEEVDENIQKPTKVQPVTN
ncbi:hypothetical protein GINT2_000237 [Glugoides intestinalis]